jgi:hypothetical protein
MITADTVAITTTTVAVGIEIKHVWRCGILSHRQIFSLFRRVTSGISGGCVLRRMNPLALCLFAGLTCGAVTPCGAAPDSAEPTKADCEAAVEQTRSMATALPADDLSRYFAERDLHQAMVEAGNGEFDECLEAAARATEEIKERRHTLQPGEKLKVLQSNE